MTPADVNKLMKQYMQMEKMMSKMAGGGMKGMLRSMKGHDGRHGWPRHAVPLMPRSQSDGARAHARAGRRTVAAAGRQAAGSTLPLSCAHHEGLSK